MKGFSKSEIKSYITTLLMLLVGSIIYALGVDLFYSRAQLLSGGVTGIALLLNYTFGCSTSLLIICINIPLFVLGWFFVNKKFVVFSACGMAMLSGFLELFKNISLPYESPLVSIVLGGVVVGVGLGIVLRSGATMGGSDIVGKIFYKYFSLNLAVFDLLINAVILVLVSIWNSIDQAVLTICAMYIATQVTSFCIDGIDHRRALLIITYIEEELSAALMEKVGRGVTVLHSMGAYTHKENSVLYIVIQKQQLATLKRVIRETDPHAFFTILVTTGVYGHGKSFVPLEDIDK